MKKNARKKIIKKLTVKARPKPKKMKKKGMEADDGEYIVTLNVRGTKIKAWMWLLRKVKESGLAAMFGGQHHIARDDDGFPYLDRDPKTFRLLLDCLMDGHLV